MDESVFGDSRFARLASLTANRRTIFKFSAGSAAALVIGSALKLDAAAQADAESPGWEFFTTPQAQAVEALAEQFWPTTDAGPGGRDAGVAIYIDRALAGALRDYQSIYQAGLGWVDDAANARFQTSFAQATPEQQLELVTAIFNKEYDPAAPAATPVATPVAEGGSDSSTGAVASPVATPAPATEEPVRKIVAGSEAPYAPTLSAFLTVALNHTMEGLFADPVYGGNKDFAGWAAIGYPGPYVVYTAEQQQSYEPLGLPLQSIADF
jgi:gluconate 2-dehydrogenase gamma chain